MSNDQSPAMTELEKIIKTSGSQSEAARRLNISVPYLSDIINGRRALSAAMLAKLGYAEIVIHVKAEQLDDALRAVTIAVGKITKGK